MGLPPVSLSISQEGEGSFLGIALQEVRAHTSDLSPTVSFFRCGIPV